MRKWIISLLVAIILAQLGFIFYRQSQLSNKTAPTTQQTEETSSLQLTETTKEPDSKPAKTEPNTKNWLSSEAEINFPILMYHSLSEGNSLRVPPAEFRQHMAWLKENDYYTLTPEEAYLVLTTNKKPAENIVWVTFDDGYLDNYEEGFPILKDLKMKATINSIIKKQKSDNGFTLEQAKEMSDSGLVSIQSHTYNHLELNQMTPAEQTEEMNSSKNFLDKNLKQDTNTLCYPVGRYDDTTIELSEKAGYKMAVTTEPGYASASDGLFALKRVRVSPGYDGAGFGNLMTSFAY
ncbi:polysaccharide deacetylase family protein [Vagococcus coleopterorum]|uniref:Polysaccharide deacetylase family protein n=1 Tax=Vagococcus coleopterorum TaxID=2714946 RepID=A0A6G8AMY8_9ENTE|nr:polysaccharide deacetylase family protein [Vagococcus coleopterorum]QIL46293.1 polysaccharide deacetylase family protein [Vagococcus coleopterorum]